jgi:hypothetical protein
VMITIVAMSSRSNCRFLKHLGILLEISWLRTCS